MEDTDSREAAGRERDHDESDASPALMSDGERHVLELYDRSVQLDYEIALLRAYKERSEGEEIFHVRTMQLSKLRMIQQACNSMGRCNTMPPRLTPGQ
jgi:hypothetical protein